MTPCVAFKVRESSIFAVFNVEDRHDRARRVSSWSTFLDNFLAQRHRDRFAELTLPRRGKFEYHELPALSAVDSPLLAIIVNLSQASVSVHVRATHVRSELNP